MYVDNTIVHNYITNYQKVNKYLCSYVCRNMNSGKGKEIHFSKNHRTIIKPKKFGIFKLSQKNFHL